MCISLHMWYTVSAGSGTPACGPGNRLDNPNFTAKTLFLYDILKRGKKDQLKKKNYDDNYNNNKKKAWDTWHAGWINLDISYL